MTKWSLLNTRAQALQIMVGAMDSIQFHALEMDGKTVVLRWMLVVIRSPYLPMS